MLEHLGEELLLGVVGLAAKFGPKVCSGHQPRLEGNGATGLTEFLHAWVLWSQLLLVGVFSLMSMRRLPPFLLICSVSSQSGYGR